MGVVADILYVLVTFAFFGVCIAYVALCDRIIGADPIGAVPRDAEQRADADAAAEVVRA